MYRNARRVNAFLAWNFSQTSSSSSAAYLTLLFSLLLPDGTHGHETVEE